MKEKRHNWKENLGEKAKVKHNKRLELLTKLDEIREKISLCGTDYQKYDELKQEQRNISAQLSTL